MIQFDGMGSAVSAYPPLVATPGSDSVRAVRPTPAQGWGGMFLLGGPR